MLNLIIVGILVIILIVLYIISAIYIHIALINIDKVKDKDSELKSAKNALGWSVALIWIFIVLFVLGIIAVVLLAIFGGGEAAAAAEVAEGGIVAGEASLSSLAEVTTTLKQTAGKLSGHIRSVPEKVKKHHGSSMMTKILTVVLIVSAIPTLIVSGLDIFAAVKISSSKSTDKHVQEAYKAAIIAAVTGVGGSITVILSYLIFKFT